MDNIVKFPEKKENIERLSKLVEEETPVLEVDVTIIDEPNLFDRIKMFLSVAFNFPISQKSGKKSKHIIRNDEDHKAKNVSPICIKSKPKYINPIIKKMYKNGEYTVNHLAHFTFIIDGDAYIYGIVELEMMGVLN